MSDLANAVEGIVAGTDADVVSHHCESATWRLELNSADKKTLIARPAESPQMAADSTDQGQGG
jgi:hypothetical protein